MPNQMSTKQQNFILRLLSERNWAEYVHGDISNFIEYTLHNSNPDNAHDVKFVSSFDASRTIRRLLSCPFAATVTQPVDTKKALFTSLQVTLKDVAPGFYALPRRDDPSVWDFFEVVQRDNGVRWVNLLQGNPGDFKRLNLELGLQNAAARAVAGDVVAAAKAFAERSGSCPRCNSPLTKAKSLVAKIGPHCAKVWGWPY